MSIFRKALMGAISFLLTFLPAIQAHAQWVRVGVSTPGGYVNTLAVSDTNLFAGNAGGVFRSSDGGTSWTPVGLTTTNIRSVAVSGSTVFAGTGDHGVFLSTNNGATWRSAKNAGLTLFNAGLYVNALAVSGPNLIAGTGGGVFCSSDNGASWTNPGVPGAVSALVVYGANLFAGSVGGGYLSTDGGTTWTVAAGLSSVHSLGFSTSSGGAGTTSLFAGASNGIFRSTDGGTNWTSTNTGLTNPYAMAFAAQGTNLFAAIANEGVFLSTNNGANWKAVNAGLSDSSVNSLAVSGTNLFAGTNWDGVFLSSNSGTTWTPANAGMTKTDVFSLAVSGTNLFAGTYSNGVYVSTNNGTSWTPVALTSSVVLSLVTHGTNLFAGTEGGAFRSTDAGTGWTSLTSGLGSDTISALAVRGTDLFIGTGIAGGVYHSGDDGTSWTTTGGPRDVRAFATSGEYLFAGTGSNGVLVSSDSGTNWTATDLTGIQVHSFAVSDTNLFAGTEDGGVFLSTNKGTNWNAVNSGLTNDKVFALAVSPASGGGDGASLFAGVNGGVFLSTNSGTTWSQTGLPNLYVSAFAIFGNSLFAATDGGIYRRALSDILPIQLASFTALRYNTNSMRLTWATASEINNYGFYVQKSPDKQNWTNVGELIHGHGTTLEPQKYSAILPIENGSWWVRLVQVDLDGARTMYDAQLIQMDAPVHFALEQNYPNPFNPSTTIRYGLPCRSNVSLTVFNPLGEQVAVLVNGTQEAGSHEVKFDGTSIASGLYFYRLTAGGFVSTRRLLLLK